MSEILRTDALMVISQVLLRYRERQYEQRIDFAAILNTVTEVRNVLITDANVQEQTMAIVEIARRYAIPLPQQQPGETN